MRSFSMIEKACSSHATQVFAFQQEYSLKGWTFYRNTDENISNVLFWHCFLQSSKNFDAPFALWSLLGLESIDWKESV